MIGITIWNTIIIFTNFLFFAIFSFVLSSRIRNPFAMLKINPNPERNLTIQKNNKKLMDKIFALKRMKNIKTVVMPSPTI